MSQMRHATQAYGRHDTPMRSLRMVEYDLLARVTQHLTAAHATRESDFPALAAALSDNLRLWTAFAADLADPGNGLPDPLRAQLFNLYQFTAQHTRKALDGTVTVDALIDINTAILRGLRGQPGGGA